MRMADLKRVRTSINPNCKTINLESLSFFSFFFFFRFYGYHFFTCSSVLSINIQKEHII